MEVTVLNSTKMASTEIDGSCTTVRQVLRDMGFLDGLDDERAYVSCMGYVIYSRWRNGADRLDETFDELGCPQVTWICIDHD